MSGAKFNMHVNIIKIQKLISFTNHNTYSRCPHPWTGVDCSDRLPPCYSSPCKNNGTCIDLQVSSYDNYKCVCPNGYTGSQCTLKLSVIDVYPRCLYNKFEEILLILISHVHQILA